MNKFKEMIESKELSIKFHGDKYLLGKDIYQIMKDENLMTQSSDIKNKKSITIYYNSKNEIKVSEIITNAGLIRSKRDAK